MDGAKGPWAPVTALELSENIRAAFTDDQPTVHDLLETAIRGRARPEVFAALNRLPRRRFRSVMDVLKELPDLPAGVPPSRHA